MSSAADSGLSAQTELTRRIIGLINLYRLLAILTLLALNLFTRPVPIFGAYSPQLFLGSTGLYLLCGVTLTLVGRHHWSGRRALVFTHTLIDSGLIAVLLYTSGGVNSGLAILLVIPVGALALLADRRDPLFVAAIAALAILAQQICSHISGFATSADYPLSGVMGAVVFLLAISVWPVSARLRESEATVRRQEIDLANLAQLSQYIVQHLRESILVVDPSDRIRLINDSAAQVLGADVAVPDALLGEAAPRLLYLLTTWRQHHSTPGSEAGTFVSRDGMRLFRPHFAPLGEATPAPVIVFLEDTEAMSARVQQSKLAALGRLSASIAHEIRNPVGAISHAAQLLSESPPLGETDQRLTEIMRSNAQRVSTIIDNVLQLSRRERPRFERLQLGPWCRQFAREFCETLQVPAEQIQISGDTLPIEVRVDPSQLHQLLWNLCQNALLHGSAQGGAGFELRLGRVVTTSRPFLEVADRGPGIDVGDAERIFEPFFTRTPRGTGLGLFLARELAQMNGATLLYTPRDAGGSVFRVVFADPTRWESLQWDA